MTAMAKPQAAEALNSVSSVRKHYLETSPGSRAERLHRQLLDVIKDEAGSRRDA